MSRPPLAQRALAYIRRHNMIKPGDRLLVAVSGGPDSTALLHVLASLEPSLGCASITVLHFDHQLRGSDSDADREFVRVLAERIGFPFHWQSRDVSAFQSERRGLSLEMAARECRHTFFRSALQNLKAQKIALGHTAADQAEELLLRLFRGTGPAGLAGMQPRTGHGIIRPLLFATRPEILEYLRERDFPFREDATNLDPFCLRNTLRLEIFPLLEEAFHPRIVDTLSRHASLAGDEEDYWRQLLDQIRDTAFVSTGPADLTLDLPYLLSRHPAVQRRILRYAVERLQGHTLGLYAVHVELLLRWIAKSTPGKSLHLPKGLRATLEAQSLTLSKLSNASASPTGSAPILIDQPGFYTFSSRRFSLKEYKRVALEGKTPPPASSRTVWLDAERIAWPMTLRLWQPGDRFQPLGLKGNKKLQDFFVDAKVPRDCRSTIPLLCDSEKIC